MDCATMQHDGPKAPNPAGMPASDTVERALDTARENMRMACALRQITMSEASTRAGLGRNAVSQFVAGRSVLSYRNMLALCDVLDVPIELMHEPDGITAGKIRLAKALHRVPDHVLRGLLDQ